MKTAEPTGEPVFLKDFRGSIFPFLESYRPTSFSLGWQEFLIFFSVTVDKQMDPGL